MYQILPHTPVIDGLIVWLADKLDVFLITLLILVILFESYLYIKSAHKVPWREWKYLGMLILVGGISVGIAQFLQYALHTLRPYILVPGASLFTLPHALGSFPSAHTTLFIALGMLLMSYRTWLGWSVIVIALIIGFARSAAGVHYVIDIIGGGLLGVIIVLGMRWIRSYFLSRFK